MSVPMDDHDVRLLAQLREVADLVDPVPAGLTDRIRLSLTMSVLEAELAELISRPLAGVRAADARGTDTLTFSGSRLSLMITVADEGDDVVVDGWVTDPSVMVQAHHADGVASVDVDGAGRFVLTLPHGPVWFVVHPVDDDQRPVITPTVTL